MSEQKNKKNPILCKFQWATSYGKKQGLAHFGWTKRTQLPCIHPLFLANVAPQKTYHHLIQLFSIYHHQLNMLR